MLRIISVNDVYTLENLPRLKTLVAHHKRDGVTTIVVMAGDFCAPSLLSSLDAGRGMVDCLNDVGVTHVILGNHEDDIPLIELRARVAQFEGVWLSTNVDFDARTRPDDVVTAGDLRVGLVGVVMTDPTLYREVPFGGAASRPANEAAMERARELMERGCTCVVPITHQPMEDDRALARSGMFPAIIGGHEHTPFLENVGNAWIVKAGSDASAAVITEIALESGKVSATTELEPVSKYDEDPELRERVDAHMSKVREIEHASLVVLEDGRTLSSIGSRRMQTSLGTFLCTAMRDALGADVCLFNGGGIRGSREYTSRFTYANLETEVPFDNEMVVVRMPGAVIRDAVTSSRSHAPAESGAFLQTDDRFDASKLEDTRDYRVAIVRNLLGGMDHIEPLIRFAREYPERVPPVHSGRDVKHVLVDAFAVALWRRLGKFDEIDANHDGVITEPEVAAALARITAEAPSHVTAQLLVRALDQNADDVISPSELDQMTK